MDDVLNTAKKCRHYAMCKIDFLGTGVCASGSLKHFVSFYPQGRMDLYSALFENKIPVTEKCIEIADSCSLCGICDYQCYFVTEMKPSLVMRAFKDFIAAYLDNGGEVSRCDDDVIIREIKKIVGEQWASSDRAIALTYSHDPCPVAVPRMPDYVIMPGTKEEVSSVVKLLNASKIPYAVRGNGSSVMGFCMTEGAVLDMGRMNTIEFDEKNWLVKTGPGVAAFNLQHEAVKRGYRVNVAEPSAMVCSNMMCSGIFSCFSAAYGTAAQNLVDAEFVAHDGTYFSLNSKSSPNIFSFEKKDSTIPGICVSVSMKLHPVTSDETAVLVPFSSLEDALDFSRECAIRRVGLALGVLGGEYISTFMSPAGKLASEVKNVFRDSLGIEYLVLVIGDRYAINSVREMGHAFVDKRLFRIINLGLPSLTSAKWLELLKEFSCDEPFSYLGLERFHDLAEAALSPSPGHLVRDVDPELKPFFEELYAKPEMTDPLWLNMFRIVSSRMGREKHVFALIIYLPMDNHLIKEINSNFKKIADKYELKNDFGFITPLDSGKRCVFEYDYYLDHTDDRERIMMQQAAAEAGMMIESYSEKTGTVKWIRYVFSQGFSRMENILYS